MKFVSLKSIRGQGQQWPCLFIIRTLDICNVYGTGKATLKVVISKPSELIWQVIFRIAYDFKNTIFRMANLRRFPAARCCITPNNEAIGLAWITTDFRLVVISPLIWISKIIKSLSGKTRKITFFRENIGNHTRTPDFKIKTLLRGSAISCEMF